MPGPRKLWNVKLDLKLYFAVGDADQLPPVGAGSFLAAAIESGAVPVVDLREVFRQAQVRLCELLCVTLVLSVTSAFDQPWVAGKM